MTDFSIQIDHLCEGHQVSERRRESLAIAIGLGADDATLIRLRDARRLARRDDIVLPPHHYEGLSRGRGWARMGSGKSVVWGERDGAGYRVGPGRWSIGATDGFSRKDSIEWTVEHVRVGDQVWTTAD